MSGPSTCPTCGHACAPWYFGMGLVGAPPWVTDFVGGSGTESPGFSGYPATRAKLVAEARQAAADLAGDGGAVAEPGWVEQHLPEGTYRDQGELLAALNPWIQGPELNGPQWLQRTNLGAIATGTRLRVPPGAIAILVRGDGTPLDVYPTGEHTLTAASAPLAAASSRGAAPGATRTALRATPVFCSTRDQEGRVQFGGKVQSGEPVRLQASVRFFLSDPSKFAKSPGGKGMRNAPTPEFVLTQVVNPQLAGLESSAAASDKSRVESVIRTALEGAGLGVRSVTVESAGAPFAPGASSAGAGPRGAPMHGGTPGQIPPEMLARMPPEMQAMVQAQMQQAMARQAAAGGAPPGAGGPSSYPPGMGIVACPACHAPNRSSLTTCRRCGGPLPPA